jgi:hypothetical protein
MSEQATGGAVWATDDVKTVTFTEEQMFAVRGLYDEIERLRGLLLKRGGSNEEVFGLGHPSWALAQGADPHNFKEPQTPQ